MELIRTYVLHATPLILLHRHQLRERSAKIIRCHCAPGYPTAAFEARWLQVTQKYERLAHSNPTVKEQNGITPLCKKLNSEFRNAIIRYMIFYAGLYTILYVLGTERCAQRITRI